MKIKTQYIITIVTFATLLLVVNLSIVYTNQLASKSASQEDIVSNIQSQVGNLNHIYNNYLLHQDDSLITSWRLNIRALSENLIKINVQDSQQNRVKNLIEDDIQQVDHAFNDTVSYLQTFPRNQSVRILPQFQSVWSQLTDNTERLSDDSALLSELFRNQIDQIHQSNFSLIVILLAVFGIYFVVNYLLTYRGTLNSISKLQEGARIIGSGNLDYPLKTERKDEIGELSNSLNNMTTSLKDMTTRLQKQERMAAIGETAAMVGHDLRNPLQSVIGEIYLSRKELQLLPDTEQKIDMLESMNMIEEQVEYMDKIVSDLQTFVKPVQVQKTIFNLKQFIIARLAAINVPENIETKVQVEENLNVNTDSQLLKRVLVNLITNAIQAMPLGGQLNIEARIENMENVKISVADTGVGIPDDVKPKLFTPLFTTKSRGQGFGLAVCKRVLEAQGGTISFESQIGKGTKFTVELPLS
jgi:signal transduction histidine kinase